MKYIALLVLATLAVAVILSMRRARAQDTAWARVVDSFAQRVRAQETDEGLSWTQGLSRGTWTTSPSDPLYFTVEPGYPQTEFIYPSSPNKWTPIAPTRALTMVKVTPQLPHRLVSADPSYVEHLLGYGLGRHLAAAPPVSLRLDPSGKLSAHTLPGETWTSENLQGAAVLLGTVAELLRGRA